MTPQDLSIADLKAVIDYTEYHGRIDYVWHHKYFMDINIACTHELNTRLRSLNIQPPTEPKTEEK